jgi:hypothetical protein
VVRELKPILSKSSPGPSAADEERLEYCWKHLTCQVDIIQKCLSQEEGLKNEDQLYVALAELKKVRDVLKGSLKFPDGAVPEPGVPQPELGARPSDRSSSSP